MKYRGYFSCTFKGENCQTHGILIKKRPSIPAPKRRVTAVKIAGRDGEIVFDDEIYDPIVIPVEFNFLASRPEAWMETFRLAKQWLRGYGRLIFCDDEDWYYYAQYVSISDTERTTKRLGNFIAEFHCDPYVYALSGDKDVNPAESGGKIFNPYMLSHPTYTITGSGSGMLTVNGHSLSFDSPGKLVIDTDRMQSWNPDTMESLNTFLNGRYYNYYFQPGANSVSVSDGFSVSVVPAWRTI